MPNIISNRISLAAGGGGLCPAYKAVYDLMAVKPTGVDKVRQNNLIKALSNSTVWAKREMGKFGFIHNETASLLDWFYPGTLAASKIGSPVFTPYIGWSGFNGATASGLINTGFTPATHCKGATNKNMTVIQTVYDPNKYANNNYYDGGSYDDTNFSPGNDNSLNFNVAANDYAAMNNCGVGATFGHFTKARSRHLAITNADITDVQSGKKQVQFYENNYYRIGTSGSQKALPVIPDFICCRNHAGGAGYYNSYRSRRQTMCRLVFQALTDDETRFVIGVLNAYTASYGYDLIKPTKNIIFEGHSFIDIDTLQCLYHVESNNELSKRATTAVTGSTLAGVYSRASAVDALFPNSKDALVIWIGANDLSVNGAGNSLYPAFKAYCQARLAAGCPKVIVFTTTPATAAVRPAPFATERTNWNLNLVNDLSNVSGVIIINTDLIANLSNPANTTYYSDGLHLTTAGYKEVYPGLLAAINA